MAHTRGFCTSMGNLERNTYVMGRITEATLGLLERKSLSDISITEIIDAAEVSRNSFYRNFDGKEDVLRRHVRGITDTWLATTEVSFRNEPLNVYFVKLLTHMSEYRRLCELLLREGLMHLIQDEFFRVFAERYEGIYDEYRARFFAGGIFSIYLLWLENGCKETPEELGAMLADILER